MFHPYKLWSLLDMLRFYAAHFVHVSTILATLDGLIKLIVHTGAGATDLDPEAHDKYRLKINWLLDMLSEMELKMSLISARKVNKWFEENTKPDKTLSDLIGALNDRIFDELHTRIVFIISSKEERFYNPEGTIFGREIADKFPNMVEDIVEAGNCFACSRYTACVFHLMRIMEITVQGFGKKLKIKLNPKDETWFKILQHVNKAIAALPEKTIKEKTKKDKYSATSVHLDNVRRVWRNGVMHPKETYTPEEAEDILGAVRLFIRDLINIL